MDFIYYGETLVNQENIDSFLSLAKELNITKITKRSHEYVTANRETTELTFREETVKMAEQAKNNEEEAVPVTDITVAADLKNLENQIKSMMEVSTATLGGAYG